MNTPFISFWKHPVFGAGFRPFFTFAFLVGVLFPLIWSAEFLQQLLTPSTFHFDLLKYSVLTPQLWHAHEMLYGFGWAVLGGFLLTASKNWVHIRGIHNAPLATLALMWLLERIYILVGGYWPWLSENIILHWLLLNLFLISTGIYILATLTYFRKNDTFKDNFFFVVGIPLFMFSKNLLLNPGTYAMGVSISIGLFRLAFAVMFERTITQFMKNSFGLNLIRNSYLDYTIKFLVLFAALEKILIIDSTVDFWAGLQILVSVLLFVRWLLWHPRQGLSNFGISLMYIGYLGLVVNFVVSGLQMLGLTPFLIGAWSIHAFTFICMGIVIPGMLIRISQGHTGRKLLFTKSDKVAFAFMGFGILFRLLATQVVPAQYSVWIVSAGLCWALTFAIIGARVVGFLWLPRTDGKEG